MPLAPELATLPDTIKAFYKAGLIRELIVGMMKGETGRDMAEDAKKLLNELESKTEVNVYGFENIPKNQGSLIVFNHPNIDVLLPAMLSLIVKVLDENGQKLKLAMVLFSLNTTRMNCWSQS